MFQIRIFRFLIAIVFCLTFFIISNCSLYFLRKVKHHGVGISRRLSEKKLDSFRKHFILESLRKKTNYSVTYNDGQRVGNIPVFYKDSKNLLPCYCDFLALRLKFARSTIHYPFLQPSKNLCQGLKIKTVYVTNCYFSSSPS